MRTTKEELNMLSVLTQKTGIIPNQVTDIYKLRRGRYNNVRIWSYMDLGTCRKKDLFITDENYKEIENFQTIKIMFNEKNVGKIDSVLSLLNTGEIKEEILKEEEKNEIKLEEVNSKKLEEIIPKRSVIAQYLI